MAEPVWTDGPIPTTRDGPGRFNLPAKFVLQPVVGGPGTSRAARRHPFIVQAIERVVKADKTGTIRAGPSPKVSSSEDFRDALGHLTNEAAGPIGKQIGEYYCKLNNL